MNLAPNWRRVLRRAWSIRLVLLACYRSGQITHAQWQEHLRDEVFAARLKRNGHF